MMKNLLANSSTLVALLAIALASLFSSNALSQSGPLKPQVFLNVAATSDYVFRGLSQSDEEPVVQGSLDLVLPGGVYAGIWASGVDKPFGAVYNQVGGDEDLEYDVYFGWNKRLRNQLTLDGGLIRYGFSPDDDDLAWTEAYASLAARGLRLKASINVEGNEIFGEYLEASYVKRVRGIDLKLHAGHFYLDEEVRLIDEYSDYSLGIAKTFPQLKRLNVQLTYHFTDKDARDRYTVAGDRFVLTLSRGFKLTK
ncbi:MAG: TorF family putative porin [Acidiferrobacterales bacterium]|nr:TorF family putative porin [Acidiferrobacterales bacterium]